MKNHKGHFPWSIIGALASAVSFFLAIFIPVNAYINNFAEFPLIRFGQVWKVSFGAFGVLFALFSLVLAVSYRNKTLFSFIVSLLAGLSLALYVQGNLINLDYGVLDGRDIPWDKMVFKGIVNTCIWLAIVLGMVWQTMKRGETGIVLVRLEMMFFLAFQCLVLGMKSFSADFSSPEPARMTTGNFMRLSSNRNVLVFMVDTLECRLFEGILAAHPEVRDWLRGFTWHRNTIGLYPTTKGALPQIITGIANDNTIPYPSYKEQAYKTSKIMREVESNGFVMDLYVPPVFAPPKSLLGDMSFIGNASKAAADDSIGFAWHGFASVANSAVFTYLPHFLKRFHQCVFIPIADTPAQEDDGDNVIVKTVDSRFFSSVGKHLMETCGEPRYKFYMLDGVHPPSFTIGKGYECLGALHDFFDEMRELGIWSNSTVIILADHGFVDKERPVILCRDRNGDEPLQISDKPFSYSNLEGVFCSALRSEPVVFPPSVGNRPFHYYSWGKRFLRNEGYLPPFFDKEYDEECNMVDRCLKAKSTYGPMDFPLMDVESISVDGTYPDTWMWTLGTNATVSLPVPTELVGKPMQLELLTFALLGKRKEKQHVSFSANGMTMDEVEYKLPDNSKCVRLSIPADVNTNSVIELSLRIDSPISPDFWGSKSVDTRPLGIRIHGFTLSSPGSVLSFTFCDDSMWHATEGILRPSRDGSGRWTYGDAAKLEISVPRGFEGHDIIMEWSVTPFLVKGNVKRQRLRIRCQGQLLFKETLADPEALENRFPIVKNISFVVPAKLIKNGSVNLELSMPDAISQKEAGVGENTRALSLFLRSCRIEMATL